MGLEMLRGHRYRPGDWWVVLYRGLIVTAVLYTYLIRDCGPMLGLNRHGGDLTHVLCDSAIVAALLCSKPVLYS
jgi:hypothetical protein